MAAKKAPDTNTPINGGLGGQPSAPPVDSQTVAQRGGGLGGSASTQKPIDTKTVAQRGGGIGSRGKKTLNPVIDKRTAKQKMKDAQRRRDS